MPRKALDEVDHDKTAYVYLGGSQVPVVVYDCTQLAEVVYAESLGVIESAIRNAILAEEDNALGQPGSVVRFEHELWLVVARGGDRLTLVEVNGNREDGYRFEVADLEMVDLLRSVNYGPHPSIEMLENFGLPIPIGAEDF